MLHLLICNALIIILTCFANVSVQADTFDRVGVLKCDSENNSFILRFGIIYNEGSIDKAELSDTTDDIANNWETSPLQEKQGCQLANGEKIYLSVKNKQAYAHGMGGGDPDATFTLKINDKNIYYQNTFYAGYGAGKQLINAISYKKNKLEECSEYKTDVENCIADGKSLSWCYYNGKKSPAIECQDVSKRLSGKDLPPAELGEFKKEQERKSLEDRLSSFCTEISVHLPNHKNDIYEYIGKFPAGHLSSVNIDINNDGKADKVFRVGGGSSDCSSCGSHYFDGSYLVAFTSSQKKTPDFVSFMNEKGYEIDIEPNIKHLPEWDAHFISLGLAGSSARYVYNVPFVYKKDSYIYSFETNREKTPSSSISKITPKNHVETICKFP